MRRDHPEKVCNLLYDKLYVDDTVYVFNDPLGQVVEQSSDLRWPGIIGWSVFPRFRDLSYSSGHMAGRPHSRIGGAAGGQGEPREGGQGRECQGGQGRLTGGDSCRAGYTGDAEEGNTSQQTWNLPLGTWHLPCTWHLSLLF